MAPNVDTVPDLQSTDELGFGDSDKQLKLPTGHRLVVGR